MDEKKQALAMIATIIAEEMDLNPQDINVDMVLMDDLDMNRDNLRQVLAACEVEFDVQYEPEDYEDIRTVGDILSSLDAWELE